MGSMPETIPESCSVLVVGGGPGGSFAATLLAREGIDVVLLEADTFPRYHIGESLLPSSRFYFRFVGLEEKFQAAGFHAKHGAAFKLNKKRAAYTNFSAMNGPENHAWNVERSKCDDIMLKYAGECGAKVHEGTKVTSLNFTPADPSMVDSNDPRVANPGRPVSAEWSRKDGSNGTIRFDYLIDASGRQGLVSMKYLKNRHYNQSLKNIANWGYWKGAKPHGLGTEEAYQPFFEALADESGWCWAIPLSSDTLSVGFVVNQAKFTAGKKAMPEGSSDVDYYKSLFKQVPIIADRLKDATMEGGTKSASDYSYRSDAVSAPHTRIIGDAGNFIDPFFSSGVHLAMTGAFSAAITIRASMRGECSELEACKWHSSKVATGYTRFLLMVTLAMKQMNNQNEPVLSDWSEDGFDKAFGFFRPVIQGAADSYNTTAAKITQDDLNSTCNFVMNYFDELDFDDQKAELTKAEAAAQKKEEELAMKARKMLPIEEAVGLSDITQDVYEGLQPRMERGNLGLTRVM